MFLLGRRNAQQPCPYRPGIAFFDSALSSVVVSYFGKLAENPEAFKFEDSYIKMCRGEYPEQCATHKRWVEDVHTVYAPFNINQSHWVALEISLNERKISVYDSDHSCTTEDRLVEAVRPMATLIPYLVKEAIPEQREVGLSLEPYVVTRVGGTPVDKECGHCGIFALKFMECLAIGCDYSGLQENSIVDIRTRFAVDVHEELPFEEVMIPFDYELRSEGLTLELLKEKAKAFIGG